LAAEIQQRSKAVRKKSMSIPDFFSTEQQALKKRFVAITKLIAQEVSCIYLICGSVF
jgi:hypothetical protein